MPHVAVDPATGEVIRRRPSDSLDTARAAAASAHEAQQSWQKRPFADRSARLRALADRLAARRDELARGMALEMGKPLSEGRAEVDKCAWVCAYSAANGEDFRRGADVSLEGARAGWVYRPLGVVLGIMPWNFPLWQFFRFAAPTVMAGNGVVLKHAPNVPGCAEAIETLVREAGLPAGLVATVYLEVDDVGSLIDDPHVHAVTLTGSVEAGRSVAERAGRALKKTVLELGGSDPSVVLSDADVEFAAAECVRSRMLNNGQSCIAAKRLIVVDRHHNTFVDRVRSHLSGFEMADPRDPETRLGPMARLDLRDRLHAQVVGSIRGGAECVLGGFVPDRAGAWYPATLLTGVQPGMPTYDEEVFGPVAAVIRAHDDEDALRIANDTRFGLGAAVYTRDIDRGAAIATDELDAGACFVNGLVRSDPRLPFGGTGISGYGRELSPLGIREFVHARTVWVAEPSNARR